MSKEISYTDVKVGDVLILKDTGNILKLRAIPYRKGAAMFVTQVSELDEENKRLFVKCKCITCDYSSGYKYVGSDRSGFSDNIFGYSFYKLSTEEIIDELQNEPLIEVFGILAGVDILAKVRMHYKQLE